ncbi:MAG: YXWGXW repeat-containing protein [Candidatus Acidiferrales bacterium]
MRNVRCLRLLLLAFVILAIPAASHAQVSVGISVRIGPPALPVYAQPICPGPRYIWTPGYWAYGPGGYYWVPGTWVMAPEVGYLWTPPYWGYAGGFYVWHRGYWGPHVGFYGGIHYGYGYEGEGYEGGYWRGDHFFYNRSVNNINVTVIHNTYNRTVINNNYTRVSYNGGRGGVDARPTREDQIAARDHHFEPTAQQVQHRDAARGNRAQWASQNHGRPGIAATPRPGQFNGRGVVRASRPGAPYRGNAAPNNRNAYRPNNRGNNQPPNRGAYRPNNRGGSQPPNRNNRPPNRNNQMRPGGPGRPNNGRPNSGRPAQNNRRGQPPKKARKPHGPGNDGHRSRR